MTNQGDKCEFLEYHQPHNYQNLHGNPRRCDGLLPPKDTGCGCHHTAVGETFCERCIRFGAETGTREAVKLGANQASEVWEARFFRLTQDVEAMLKDWPESVPSGVVRETIRDALSTPSAR